MLTECDRIVKLLSDAIAKATDIGLVIASVGGSEYAELLPDHVDSGRVSETRLDENVRRVLELKFELGLFDDPYGSPERAVDRLGTERHHRVAREAAEKPAILLKNEGDILPRKEPMGVFVTEPNADSLDDLLGVDCLWVR